MPYSTPSTPTVSLPHSSSRPSHRRAHTVQHHQVHSPTFSKEKGPGTFTSLGSLPRRRGASKFRIQSDSSEDESDHVPHIPLKTKAPSFRLDVSGIRAAMPTNGAAKVPFPRSSPLLSPGADDSIPPFRSARPSLTRTSSHPIILSNGKPLKSSLKSSSSTGSVAGLVAPLKSDTQIRHARAKSAPSTPRYGLLSDDSDEDPSSAPSTPKNVHFADSLTNVRVFNRSARPASVSLPLGKHFCPYRTTIIQWRYRF